MRLFFTLFFLSFLAVSNNLSAQTVIQTSFETAPAPSYTPGTINGQNNWTVTSSNGLIGGAVVHSGSQALNLSATAAALRTDYIPYSGNVPGITGEVFADFWVNPATVQTTHFTINGFDLYGGSGRRIFVIEFNTNNSINAYNGTSRASLGVNWTASQWTRISVKVNFVDSSYKVAVNNVVNAATFNFREQYTPSASGTRVANVRELHSIRFNHGSDGTVATSNVAIDDMYIGATVPAGVPFTTIGTRTITVNQPAYGSISLSPNTPTYTLNQAVTATLTVPQGYINNGWTGNLSGTELVKNFTVTDNLTIGADVAVDANNPPPKYLITVNQPANGTITLSPSYPDNLYYKETVVTATVTFDVCSQLAGYTGDLSGTTNPKTFTVQQPMTIGANIIVNNNPRTTRTVSTVAEFKAALAAMNPGDSILVNNGNYDLSSLSITRTGCEIRPIIVTAKNPGMAVLNGATALVFKNLKYVTWKGFTFQSVSIGTGIKLENCNKVRITENAFAITETAACTWIIIGDTYASPEPLRSGYNRIDHNSFDGKTQLGNFIRMDGNINQQSQYDTIDYNIFKNNGPRAVNGQESIRVGVSTLSLSSGFTVIEHNLFQDCDGDPEIVSVKSCDNSIRFNTFQRCLGSLTLRQGYRNTVEGNYFFGEGKTAVAGAGTIGCGGVRVYSKDHKVINNYFEGLTGVRFDAAICLPNGDVDSTSTDLAQHFLPQHCTIAFNTLVNNKSNIEIGYNNSTNQYPLAPYQCIMANNIAIDNTAPIIKSYSAASLAQVMLANNMLFPTGTSSVGITANASQVIVADPQLVQPACVNQSGDCQLTLAYRVKRLSATSPAINASAGTYSYVTGDFEMGARSGIADIGADEFTGSYTATTGALDENQVGPGAVPYAYSYSFGSVVPLIVTGFNAVAEKSTTAVSWTVSNEINIDRYEMQWSKDGLQFSSFNAVAATGAAAYSAIHYSPVTGKNFYRLKIIETSGNFSYGPVKMIVFGGQKAFSVYPNPASVFIQFDLGAAPLTGTTLTVINAAGSVVKKATGFAPGLNKIDVQALAAGIYVLRIASPGAAPVTHRFTILK